MFACSEAELRLTVITVRKDLLQNVPPILPRNIGQIGPRAILLVQLLPEHQISRKERRHAEYLIGELMSRILTLTTLCLIGGVPPLLQIPKAC